MSALRGDRVLARVRGLSDEQRAALLRAGYERCAQVLAATPIELSDALPLRSAEAHPIARSPHACARARCARFHLGALDSTRLDPRRAQEVNAIVAAVAAAVAPRPRDANALLELLGGEGAQCELAPVRTGLPPLDAHLGGGVSVGGLTELVGPAAIGKTQLGLSAAA